MPGNHGCVMGQISSKLGGNLRSHFEQRLFFCSKVVYSTMDHLQKQGVNLSFENAPPPENERMSPKKGPCQKEISFSNQHFRAVSFRGSRWVSDFVDPSHLTVELHHYNYL